MQRFTAATNSLGRIGFISGYEPAAEQGEGVRVSKIYVIIEQKNARF